MTRKKYIPEKLVERLIKKISQDEVTALVIYAGCEMEITVEENGENYSFVYGTKYKVSIDPQIDKGRIVIREKRPEGIKTMILEKK